MLPDKEFPYLYKCNKCFKEIALKHAEADGEHHNIGYCDGILILIGTLIPTKPIDLQTLLKFIYIHEINVQINWMWDSRVDVKIGDEMNGYKAEANILIGDVTEWLYQNLKRIYSELKWSEI
jgi:hypothetical protein